MLEGTSDGFSRLQDVFELCSFMAVVVPVNMTHMRLRTATLADKPPDELTKGLRSMGGEN